MSKLTLRIAVVATMLLAAALAYWLLRPVPPARSTAPAGDPQTAVAEAGGASEPVQLFFPAGNALYTETYEIPSGGSVEERMTAALGGLLAGPRSANLQAPLPAGVRIGAVFLLERTAYVDLVSDVVPVIPGSGSQREMLTAYSLVHSLVTNFAEVEAVVLLVNGRQPVTLAGHLDTTRPLGLDPRWNAR